MNKLICNFIAQLHTLINMNKTAHSRTRTDYHPPISSIHTKNAAFAAIRVKTTPS